MIDPKRLIGAVLVSAGAASTGFMSWTAYHTAPEAAPNAVVVSKVQEWAAQAEKLQTESLKPAYKFTAVGPSKEYLGSGEVSTKILLDKLTASMKEDGNKLETEKPPQ